VEIAALHVDKLIHAVVTSTARRGSGWRRLA
jgi:hypothetical protein